MKDGVSVIVPAFNEGETLAVAIERILQALALLRAERPFELIVVDDGSTDRTADVLHACAAVHRELLAVGHARNRGLVAAIRTGVAVAQFPTVVLLDADLSYAPGVVEQLVTARETAEAVVAIASPYAAGGRVTNVPFDRLVASRAANWLLARCLGGRVKTFTGMVRAYDTSFLREVLERPYRGEFNAAVIAEVVARRLRFVEVPATLAWPAERRTGAARITFRQLVRRSAQVLDTIAVLVRARAIALQAVLGYTTGNLPPVHGMLNVGCESVRRSSVIDTARIESGSLEPDSRARQVVSRCGESNRDDAGRIS